MYSIFAILSASAYSPFSKIIRVQNPILKGLLTLLDVAIVLAVEFYILLALFHYTLMLLFRDGPGTYPYAVTIAIVILVAGTIYFFREAAREVDQAAQSRQSLDAFVASLNAAQARAETQTQAEDETPAPVETANPQP